jgi:putative transposase
MVRPIRIGYAGALYHVTSRGNRRENLYLDDEDRMDWLAVLGQTCKRFNWVVHAYCQMTNHYHLLVETIDGNLSRGMRQLNAWAPIDLTAIRETVYLFNLNSLCRDTFFMPFCR